MWFIFVFQEICYSFTATYDFIFPHFASACLLWRKALGNKFAVNIHTESITIIQVICPMRIAHIVQLVCNYSLTFFGKFFYKFRYEVFFCHSLHLAHLNVNRATTKLTIFKSYNSPLYWYSIILTSEIGVKAYR